MSSVSPIQIPSRLPLLLTHEGVLLPGSTMRTSVDSARNLQLVRSRLLQGTSLQSTILGVIPNTPDPASDAQDLPPLHRWAAAPAGRAWLPRLPLRPRGAGRGFSEVPSPPRPPHPRPAPSAPALLPAPPFLRSLRPELPARSSSPSRRVPPPLR